MINKHEELHNKLLDLIADYHNSHVKFIARPTHWGGRDMSRVLLKIGKLVKEIRKNHLEIRNQLLNEKREHIKEERIKKETKKNVKHT